jgi:hypothetical protein
LAVITARTPDGLGMATAISVTRRVAGLRKQHMHSLEHSVRGVAAVDRKRHAEHEAGAGAAQLQYGRRNFLCPPHEQDHAL